MKLRMKNFNVMGVYKKPIYRWEIASKGGLGQFAGLSGGLGK